MSDEAAKETPYASFVLAWTTLCLWILGAPRRGEDLYGEREPWPGWPHPGWVDIPAACINAAIRLRGLYGSQLLAEEAYAVLQVSWRRHIDFRNVLARPIAKYRRLRETIAGRHDMAVASLSDDLRDACSNGTGRIRPRLAAMLWSLGLVPECSAFMATAGPPSRPLLRRLVERSMQCLPTDPLIQYLWLEMKDEAGIHLRAHEALFIVINHQWSQWQLDDLYTDFGMSAPPSRLYARTLTALLAGDLQEADAAEYLHAFDLIIDGHLPQAPTGFSLHRLHMLRYLIGGRFGYYGPEFTDQARVEYLKERTDATARGREQIGQHPELPEVLGRNSHASFEFIERCMSDETRLEWPERDRCVLALATIERFRTGALSYWLRLTPPFMLSAADRELDGLFREERELLEQLRGAYFLVLSPTLPLHLLWSDMELADRMALDDPARRNWFYSPDVARNEMEQVERALTDLAGRLQACAPTDAERRRDPSVTPRAVGCHARQSRSTLAAVKRISD